MGNVIKEFSSIAAFEKYINDTPLNDIHRWRPLSSSQPKEYGFNQTNTFEEALDLLKHGWSEQAAKLEKRLQLMAKEIQPMKAQRMRYDVAGFQACVPRYLQGVPESMINKKTIVKKQKVITIVKHIGYLANVTAETIVEHSLRALMIVKKVEAMGYRVNLDVISPAQSTGSQELAVCRIRIKSADERLNVSKVAFPLVHPDMLRRMIFRFREVSPELEDKYGWLTMGRSMYDRYKVKQYLKPTDYYLHNFVDDVDEEIRQFKLN